MKYKYIRILLTTTTTTKMTMEECLKKQVTKTISLGDCFKLIIPFGWTIVAFMATLAYLLAPLRRKEPPRWGTASLVSLSAFAGVGACVAIYNFHRTASYQLSNTDTDAVKKRIKSLFVHIVISSIFIVTSIVLAIFFAFIAPDLDVCSHETCGADVSWSLIALMVSLVWAISTIIAYKHIQQMNLQQDHDIEVSDIHMDKI